VIVLERLRHRLVQKKEAERRILLRNMAGGVSEIRAKSADNPVSLLGEGLDFVVVDEAARLKPLIWQNHVSQRSDRQARLGAPDLDAEGQGLLLRPVPSRPGAGARRGARVVEHAELDEPAARSRLDRG
jgi:hypothetical protein